MTALAAVERAALDAAAVSLHGEWRLRRGRAELVMDGTPSLVRLHTVRRPVAARALRPPTLRFERVVLRVCRALNAAAPRCLPVGTLGFVTLQAPIRQASKTVAAIESKLACLGRGKPTGGVRASSLLGNRVRLGLLPLPRQMAARLVCLVHTDDADAGRLLSMTRDLLALGAQPTSPALPRWWVIATPERSALQPAYRHIFSLLRLSIPTVIVFADGTTGRLD